MPLSQPYVSRHRHQIPDIRHKNMKGTARMKRIPPVMPETLEMDDGKQLFDKQEQEERFSGKQFVNIKAEEQDFTYLMFSAVSFENCRFINCSFAKGEFTDVKFKSCDFSGCNLSSTYFNRVEFEGCKGTGAKFTGTNMKQTFLEDTVLQYANFDESKLEHIWFRKCDLNGSSLSVCRCKDLNWCNADLSNVNFFHTTLKGMDFSDSIITGITISDQNEELRGATVDLYQAAVLARRLGVLIKETES